ncbi:MAG TPA: hypothetical protein ENN77_02460 [Candidatus Wirthbacteria bacterium]|nr:hypothetical protein [Candidatus Wirthbacteria bacterium]
MTRQPHKKIYPILFFMFFLTGCLGHPKPKSTKNAVLNQQFDSFTNQAYTCELASQADQLLKPTLTNYFGEIKYQNPRQCEAELLIGVGYAVAYLLEPEDADPLDKMLKSAGFKSSSKDETNQQEIKLVYQKDLDSITRNWVILLDMKNQMIWVNVY